MENDPAIQPDVEKVVEATPEPDTPVLERDQIMSDIAQRRREERDAELEDLGLKPDEDPEQDVPVSEPELDTPEPAVAEPDTPEKAKVNDELVPLNVMGRTIYKTQQQIDDAGGIPAIQKSIAGDIKLENAALKEKELNQRELDLNMREQSSPVQNAQPAPEATSKTDLRAIAENLVVGDVDKVAESLQQIIQRPQPSQPAVDPDQIATQAAQLARQDLAVDNARNQFSIDFPDISNHAGKRKLANEHTKILMQENPSWTPSQIITEAGRRTRADLGITAPATAEKVVDPLTAKQHRKAATVDTLQQASTRRVETSTEYQPKTQRQIFESIEASRSH